VHQKGVRPPRLHTLLYLTTHKNGNDHLVLLYTEYMKDDIYKSAGIIIVDRKLLFTRAEDMQVFIDPGGKIEPGESAKQALIRELKEELTIDVDESDLEPFGEYIAEAANHKGHTVHMQAFIIKKWRGEITASSEIEELRWLTSSLPTDIKVGSIFGGQVLPKLHEQGLVD
jgi:8-oxo-dGTP diphosphatase